MICSAKLISALDSCATEGCNQVCLFNKKIFLIFYLHFILFIRVFKFEIVYHSPRERGVFVLNSRPYNISATGDIMAPEITGNSTVCVTIWSGYQQK